MSSEDRFFESVIRKALPHHYDVHFCMTDTYHTIEPRNEGVSNVFIRPLHHLVSCHYKHEEDCMGHCSRISVHYRPSYLQCGLY